MDVNVKYFLSMNSDVEKRNAENYAFLKEIGEAADINFHLEDHIEAVPEVVFVGGGGVEGKFKTALPTLTDPIIILTSGENNSLAASMEILSYLKKEGRKGMILHGSHQDVAKRLKAIIMAQNALLSLKGMRLGQIGKPSDWLIASDADAKQLKTKTGMEIVDIDIEELFAEIKKESYPENQYTEDLKKHAFDRDELEKALYIYGALYRLKEKYQLRAMTVRCFDLLEPFKNTGCLGLAILNAQGIYSGCEGDMQSLISMAIIGEISKQPVFMCNPSRINSQNKDIVLAHCTLPLNMPCTYHLMTHYESGLGVAIAGHIPEGEVTIFKCAADMSRYFVEKGEIKRNLCETALCRTQIELHLDHGMDYFVNEPIGNHHLIVLGDHSAAVKEFFAML